MHIVQRFRENLEKEYGQVREWPVEVSDVYAETVTKFGRSANGKEADRLGN